MNEIQYRNFAQYIVENSKTYRHKTAIITDVNNINYNDLTDAFKSFAKKLTLKNIRPGDRVIICLDESVEWVVAFLACNFIGAVPVLTSTKMGTKVLTEIIDVSKARAIIWDEHDHDMAQRLSITEFRKVEVNTYSTPLEQWYDFDPDENCLWSTSSGTTGGKRKYIPHRHAAIYLGTQKVAESFKVNNSSIFYTTAKLSFLYGFNEMMLALANNATAIISNRAPVRETVLDIVKTHKVTHIWTTPTPVVHMIKHAEVTDALESIVSLFCGGEPLPNDAAVNFQKIYNISVLNGYGISEGMNIMCSQTPDDQRLGTIGRPMPGVVCEVRRPDGTLSDIGELGILYVKDPSSALYYHNNWTRSKEVFRGDWINTGDICFGDENGYLIYVCRDDELVKVNGLFVTPTEIEEVLISNDSIEECVVTSYRNRFGLNEIEAYIVPKKEANITISSIKEFLLLNIEAYKIPKTIRFVDRLPKTVTTKKIRNNRLIKEFYNEIMT
jgi:benzoate-CoA ligase